MDRPEYKYFIDRRAEQQADKIFYKFVVVLFAIYLLIFGVVMAFRANFVYVTIKGASMQNTLNKNPVTIEGERVQDGVYIKLTHNADYGDIIVINRTEDDSVIKRALAFGGDYITIANVNYDGNREYRFMRIKNDCDDVEILKEDYIKSYESWNSIDGKIINNVEYEDPFYDNFQTLGYQTKTVNMQLGGEEKQVVFFQVPEDNVFFMGDNRTGSWDARTMGTVNIKYIEGYVVRIVHNGTIIKQNGFSWFFQQIGDFFSIIWQEFLSFFGVNG